MGSKRKPVRRGCTRCQREGHATLLWNYLHGWYCVLCIREMMGVVADFVANEPHDLQATDELAGGLLSLIGRKRPGRKAQ